MSDGPRIPLEKAEEFVLAMFQRRLGFATLDEAAREGVEVVGSIRRRRSDIGDIEIIAPMPRAADPEKVQSSEDRLFRELNLCVLNPEGFFFNKSVCLDGNESPKGGTWHWPPRV